MKKVIILLVALVGMINASGQSCLPDGIIFNSQEEIDNFPLLYGWCTEIEGFVWIGGSSSITDLTMLQNLTSIGGYLRITANESLTNLYGLENITTVGGAMWIHDNDALTSLAGLESLTSVGSNLWIEGNNSLTSFIGLENFISVGNWMKIEENYALVNMTGLESLSSIGNYLKVVNNDNMTSLAGLESLSSIGDYLKVEYNDALNCFTGLDNLISINGELWIFQNSSLTSLVGLESLMSINGSLKISFNHSLVSLAGLESLTTINGEFRISNNNSITSLLEMTCSIEPNSIDTIVINTNPNLDKCNAYSICNCIAAGGTTYIAIANNAPGCNSELEVEEACLTTVEEIETDNEIKIIPNPSKDKITLSSPAITGNTLLSIFNVSGEKVIEMQLTETETQIDISALPRGVYFVKLQNEKMVEVGKMVKE